MIQLRLDAGALAALFPEGTEARVELQKAVVAEFLKKNSPRLEVIKTLLEDIDRKIEAQLDAEILAKVRAKVHTALASAFPGEGA